LSYVVRKDRDDALPFATEEERLLYSIAHQGEAYKADNKKVFQIMTELLSDTPAWTWISRYEKTANGRLAMKALRDHYDGPGEVEKRLAHAYNELANAYYRSERKFPLSPTSPSYQKHLRSWKTMESLSTSGKKWTTY